MTASPRHRARGSALLVVVFGFGVLSAVLALAVDAGVLAAERARLDRIAEAAAVAGARALCAGEAARAAQSVAAELGADPAALQVAVGRLRESEGEPPAFEVAHGAGRAGGADAVRVEVAQAVEPLLAPPGRRGVTVRAAATARLLVPDFASLDPHGEVRVFARPGTRAGLFGGWLHAEGNLVLAGEPLRGVRAEATGGWFRATAPPAVFCLNPAADRSAVFASRGLVRRGGEAPGPRLVLRPVDQAVLEGWRARAGRVVAPGDRHGVVYRVTPSPRPTGTPLGSRRLAYLDLRAARPEGAVGRSVVYFEPAGDEVAVIDAAADPGRDPERAPVRGLVLVTPAPVVLRGGLPARPVRWGGPGEERLTVVSGAGIYVRLDHADARGLVLRAGGDIWIDGGRRFGPRSPQRIRAIADGDLEILECEVPYEPVAAPACPGGLARVVGARLATRSP